MGCCSSHQQRDGTRLDEGSTLTAQTPAWSSVDLDPPTVLQFSAGYVRVMRAGHDAVKVKERNFIQHQLSVQYSLWPVTMGVPSPSDLRWKDAVQSGALWQFVLPTLGELGAMPETVFVLRVRGANARQGRVTHTSVGHLVRVSGMVQVQSCTRSVCSRSYGWVFVACQILLWARGGFRCTLMLVSWLPYQRAWVCSWLVCGRNNYTGAASTGSIRSCPAGPERH